MNISGIYQIQSEKKPDRIYVGSAVNIQKRWLHHLSDLRLNKHTNKKLQGHFNKYGEVDLKFTILICCDKEDLINHEQFFIDLKNPSFNICKKAQSMLGFKQPSEVIEKLKIRMRGQKYHLGFKNSEESRLKMSKDRKGRKMSPECIEKQRLRMMGNKYTLGYKASVETKAKMSKGKKGKQYRKGSNATIETRNKMSITHKEIWRKRKLVS